MRKRPVWSKTWNVPATSAVGSAVSCCILAFRQGVATFWWAPLAAELARLGILGLLLVIVLQTRGQDARRDQIIDFAVMALLISSFLADTETMLTLHAGPWK